MIPDDEYEDSSHFHHDSDHDHEDGEFALSHHGASKSGHVSVLRRSLVYSELEEDIQRVRLEDRKREEEMQKARRLQEQKRLLAQNSFYYATKKKLEKRRATATNLDLLSFISIPRASYAAIEPLEEGEVPSVQSIATTTRGSKAKSTTWFQTPEKRVSLGEERKRFSAPQTPTDYESMSHVNFPLRRKSDDQQPPRSSTNSSALPVLTKKKRKSPHKKRRGTSVGLKLFSNPEVENQHRRDETTLGGGGHGHHHRRPSINPSHRRRRRSTGHHHHRKDSKDKSGAILHDKPWNEY
ncbi:uncharacterized protein LOC118437629 [Folsomia candida]|uniref:uncharacterized protein LOC118437629 n=1 Tax=Folsomia candida TaxID=158441 RepID=UPI00160515BA|nr:uncharacterized protein LOC118437629 [Folsomia candida]